MEPEPPRTFGIVARLDHRLNRLGVTTVVGRDRLLATVTALVSLAVLGGYVVFVPDLDGIHFGTPAIAGLAVVTAAQSAALCLRRTRPVTCLLLTALGQVGLIALLPAGGSFRGLATYIAAYTVGTLLSTRAIVAAMIAALGIETVGGTAATVARPLIAAWTDTSVSTDEALNTATLIVFVAISAVLVYGVAPLIGTHIAIRRRHLRLIRDRAAEQVAAQRAKAGAAVAAERSRLARELHDIAAHHLSGLVVQAAAVQRLIDTDPAAAKEGTGWIREQGKETLRNLRMVVGVLRDRPDDRPAGLGEDSAPVPGLADLDSLADTARRLGNPVAVRRHGAPRDLPPIADVTLYRVAQEALSNVRQYAPGSAVRVELDYAATRVRLDIDNAAATAPPRAEPREGMGLIGMRERVQLVGGTLTHGPTGTGWRVSATVPDRVPSSTTTDKDGSP